MAIDCLPDGDHGMDQILVNAMVGLSLLGMYRFLVFFKCFISSLSISTASVHTNDNYKLMDCLELQVIKEIAMTVLNISGYMGTVSVSCQVVKKVMISRRKQNVWHVALIVVAEIMKK